MSTMWSCHFCLSDNLERYYTCWNCGKYRIESDNARQKLRDSMSDPRVQLQRDEPIAGDLSLMPPARLAETLERSDLVRQPPAGYSMSAEQAELEAERVAKRAQKQLAKRSFLHQVIKAFCDGCVYGLAAVGVATLVVAIWHIVTR